MIPQFRFVHGRAVAACVSLLILAVCFSDAQVTYSPLPLSEKERRSLSAVAGRSIFLCGTAELTKVEMASRGPEEKPQLAWGTRLPPLAFGHLKPLPIAAIEKTAEISHMTVWAIRVKLGEDRYGVLRSVTKEDELLSSADPLAVLVAKVNAESPWRPISLTLPQGFTPLELRSIQGAYAERGISEDALECAIGPPERTNDYGKAGKQLVYNGGNLLVYTDSSGRVEEIHQSY